MESIVIYRLGSIGDTVAALPCFHLIERSFPSAQRLVLTNFPVSAKAAPLELVLGTSGLIHGSVRYPLSLRSPTGLASLARDLKALNARTLVYLAASRGQAAAWRDVAYFKLCGFRTIIGAPLSRDLQANRVMADGSVERESERLTRALASLGTIDLTDRAWWDLRLTEGEHAVAETVLQELAVTRFVAVNTGGKAAEKDWGTARWSSLLDRLATSLPHAGLVFVGGAEDSERAVTLSRHWTAGPQLDLCGRLSPRETAAALGRATLFVGHDSGPLHLADAVGTAAIGLFGDYNRPRKWHPSGDRTRIIHRMSGLHDIAPAEVAAVASDLVSVAV